MKTFDIDRYLFRLKMRIGFIFAAVSAMIIAGGGIYYRHYQASLISNAGALLTSIEHYKIEELNVWRADRLDDALFLLDSPALAATLNRFAANPGDQQLKSTLRAHLLSYLKHNKYRAAFLAGPDGRILVSTLKNAAPLCPEAKAMIKQAARTGLPVLGDLYLVPGEGGRHLDLAAPAAAGKNGEKLFLVLRIDPEDYLYPLIKSWPTQSRSGETLLVKKEGGDALFLNKLRNLAGEPMTVRLPLNRSDLPAAMALAGKTGVFSGVDYRGKPVLAATARVPGTDWGFVAKLDLDEVMADSTAVAVLLGLVILFLLSAAGGATYLLFRQQSAEHLAALKAADALLAHSEDKFRLFFENSPLGKSINGLDGSLHVNRAFCAMLGYSEQELRGKTWQDLTPAEEVEHTQGLISSLLSGERSSVQFEKRYIRKDGGIVDAEVTTAVQRNAAGNPEYLITSVNNINARKAAEKALRESELALREAQQLAKVGSWEFDPATGEGAWTEEVARIHDLEPGQSTDMALGLSFYTGAARAKIDAAIKKAIEDGEAYDLELEMTTAKGAHKWVHTIGQAAVKDGRTVKVRGTFQDITDKKLAEEALKASESAVRRKLSAIMEPEGDLGTLELTDIFDIPALQVLMDELHKLTNITSAILGIDGKVLVASGWQDICTKFHRVNPETCRHCTESDTVLAKGIPQGTSRSYFCRNNLRDVATPIIVGGRHVANFFLGQFLYEDEPHDYEMFREQARRYGFNEKEYMAAYERVPAFSRERIDVLITFYGQVMDLLSSLSYGRIKLARALAQSESTGAQLRESERRLAALFSNLPGIAYRCLNERSFGMEFVSEGCRKLTGYEKEELVGEQAMIFNEIIVPADRDRVWQEIQTALAEGRNFQLTYDITRKDGELRSVWEQGLGVKDSDGKVTALEGFISDVTERAIAEREKEKLNAALIETNREMENFLYITTHDLRSPLVNIQGFSQNLERYLKELREVLAQAPLEPEARPAVDKLISESMPGALKFVLGSSRKMDALITALLKVSRLGRVEMKPETVDMNQLLKRITGTLRFQLDGAGGTVNCGNLPPCRADAGAVSQLFSNLLDNAIRYCDDKRQPVINVDGEVKNGFALYKVSDNGYGIPAADLGRIWEVFYQPERVSARKGEGIGLPMVKRIIEKNGGRIRVESKEGEGSVFYVELPAAEEGKNG